MTREDYRDIDNTKMIELTVSGVVRTKPASDEDAYSFADFKMVIPNCHPDYHITHVQRMFELLKKEDEELKKVPFHGLMKTYIDDYKEVKGTPECIGKDIKKMTWIELQHLACCLLVREIPFYMKTDLRAAREKAYETYMKVIKKKKVLKSGKDKKALEERIRRKYDIEEYTQAEIEQAVQRAIKNSFNMIVDANNPANSYDFAKLEPLVPMPAKKTSKAKEDDA